ncbi:MAG: PEP-CTERM sorting domain-containing protein, partial [Burkholderiaceae bacterium]
TGQGKITTTWQEWEPVYGWVDNWINPIVDYDCSYFDGRGPECLPVYGDLTNVPVWSVTGGEYITQAQTLSFSPLIVLDRPSSVPEPATIALVVIALAGLFLSQRKIVI